jgi:hypothetical protein
VKCRSIFFDVDFDGNKSLLDYSGQLRIGVRLGIQPSAGDSRWCGAEVEKRGLVGGFGLGKSGVNVVVPFNGHL